MDRVAQSFKSAFYIQTGGPVGYGIYLTDKRLIGVSYKKVVSRAYRPAFVLFLIWIFSLVSLLIYSRLTGARDLPPLPFVMSLIIVDLILLVYWSPKQASGRVERKGTVKSVEELQQLVPDVVLNRSEISQVTARPSTFIVFMRSGESHTFLSKKLSGDKSQLLLRLFQVFCSWTPLVEMTISDASGKNVRKVVEPGSGDEKEGWVTFRRPISGQEERVWIPHKLTFEEAQGLPDAYAIMEGEFGYQCYLTAPLRIIRCPEPELRELLLDLDQICCDMLEGRHIRYEEHKPGDFISNGMGGGEIVDDVWIHPQLVDFGLLERIREMLSGKISRLGLNPEEVNELRARWRDPEENSKYQGVLTLPDLNRFWYGSAQPHRNP